MALVQKLDSKSPHFYHLPKPIIISQQIYQLDSKYPMSQLCNTSNMLLYIKIRKLKKDANFRLIFLEIQL